MPQPGQGSEVVVGGVAGSRPAALGIAEAQKGGQDKKEPPENPYLQHRRSELMTEGQTLAGKKPSLIGGRDCVGSGLAKVDRAGELWNPVLVRGATASKHHSWSTASKSQSD